MKTELTLKERIYRKAWIRYSQGITGNYASESLMLSIENRIGR